MPSFIESVTTGENHGNEGDFVMTQLNAARQSIKSHVAVRVESAQTEILVTINHIWPWMSHLLGASKGCLDGVHVRIYIYVCVCVGMWHVCLKAIPVSLVFWVETLRPFCAAGRAVWILAFVKFCRREKIFRGHCQLSPFRHINLCCLPNMFWHFKQSPFRRRSNPTFLFFKIGEKNLFSVNKKYSQALKLNVHLCNFLFSWILKQECLFHNTNHSNDPHCVFQRSHT